MISKLLKGSLAPFSAGIIVGIALYPYYKKGLEKLKPVGDDLLDNALGKAHGVAENVTHSLAEARSRAEDRAKR